MSDQSLGKGNGGAGLQSSMSVRDCAQHGTSDVRIGRKRKARKQHSIDNALLPGLPIFH